VAFGPLVGGLVGIVAGSVVAAVLGGLLSAIYGLLVILVIAATLAVAGVLRLFELLSLRIRGITVECPNCHHRVLAPVYECPHCPATEPSLHRHLIPGSLGVVSRICRCGHSLPTLLIRGKSKLTAYCQREECKGLLPEEAYTAPTFHVPVVAGTSAGKTVFMTATVARMEAKSRSAADGFSLEFADGRAKEEYQKARAALQDAAFGAIRATQPVMRVRAFNVYVHSHQISRRLLYLYDPAGERYETSGGIATFRFLKFTDGVVLIVDPFSFPSVRELAPQSTVDDVRPSQSDAEEMFGRFAQNLREHLGTKVDRKLAMPIAVVITKADALLSATGVQHPYDGLGDEIGDRDARSEGARNWLIETAGQRGLVATLENSFARCGYFAVSALDAFTVRVRSSGQTQTKVRNDDPSAPVLWLLNHRLVEAK
jgi:hypothetical protein